jgi:hypothetical protein
MKKNKFVRGLSLTIFVALCGGGVAYAESDTSTNDQITNADKIQSQNSRHKLPHVDRKAAAVRLRDAHELQRQQKLVDSANTGNGQRGQQ